MIRHLRAAAAALLLLFLWTAGAHAAANGAIGCTGVSANFQSVTCPDINEELANANQRGIIRLSSVAGTNTITANAAPYALTSYADGQHFTIKPANGNTGAVTLNINSLGAKAIVKQSGSALASGDLAASTIYTLSYYASDDHFRVMGAVGTPGADDDVPEAGDYTNLTGGAGITNSPTGTINFDATEINSATWGAGSFTAFTFNAGAVDPVVTFGSGTVTWSAVSTFSLDDEAEFRLLEEDANGSNYIGIKPPAAITSNVTCTLENDSTPFDTCVTGVSDGDKGDITVTVGVWNIDAGTIGPTEIATDGVSADELNATGVEPELEAVLDLTDLQGDLALGTKTSGNYMSGLSAGAGIAVTHTPAEGSTGTVALDYSSAAGNPALGAGQCRFATDTTAQIVCEGTTADTAETRIIITDPTADRALTIPDADTVSVQGADCTAGNYVRAINATTGAITCAADAGAGGGISNISEDTDPELGGALDTAGFAIEFGNNQTDTSMARSSAGNVSIEGVEVTTASNTQTLTGKSIAATQITAGALNIGNNAATVGTVELANGAANTLSASGGVLSIEGVALATTAAATTSAQGLVELATTAEAAAQTDTTRAVTPAGLAFKPESFCVAASDETTSITTGTNKVRFRMPYAFTLTAVRASVNTAPTGSTIIIDINEGGSTLMTTTKLSIDASETTSTTAASAAVLTDTALADDALIGIDFDQVGSSTPGNGVKVCLIGHQ